MMEPQLRGREGQVLGDQDAHLFSESDYHLPKGQCPLAPVTDRHRADHEFDSVWHPLSQTESWPLNQKRIWVKFRRTTHHRFFFFCKSQAFTWCYEERGSSKFI